MKLRYFGHSCFSMTFQDGTVLVTDPFDESVGYPLCRVRADAALTSHDHFDHNHVESLAGAPARVSGPGRRTVGGAEIEGIASFHDDARGAKRGNNTIFRVTGDGVRLAHLGDLGHMLSAQQLAELGPVDVLLVPVGGHFTIDTAQAVELVRAIRPRMAVAMHFKTPAINFPITDAGAFAEALGAAALPCEIEITPENLGALPGAAVMDWQE